jgi:hypothetical protein
MKTFLLIPVILSLLVAAAHWLHAGNLVLTALCLAAPFLLFVRRGWSVRIVQTILALMTLEWICTALNLVHERQAEELPWQRSAVILGAVALVSCLSIFALSAKSLRSRYANSAGGPASASPSCDQYS